MKPLIISTIIAGGVAASSVQGALIGHWAFDEGSGTTAGDSSPGGLNPGAIVGATWASDGTRASFLSFDGNDDSVDPTLTLPAMSTTNDFTWAFWANRGGNEPNEVIIGNRYNGPGASDFSPRQFIKFTPTQFEWHQNGNGNDNFDYADLVVGEWHHHAIVKTGTTIEYFLDGVSQGTSTLNEAIGGAAHPFFIGGNPGSPAGEHFLGGIDDVRIYDNALTAGEVAALLIPEPSAFVLGAFGVASILVRRRR